MGELLMVRKIFRRDPWSSEEEFWDGVQDELSSIGMYATEPLMDIRDEGKVLKVIIEANGSKEKDIRIEKLGSRYLAISLKHRGTQIRKRIEVPTKIKNAYLFKIKNGVAQIIVEKE